MKCDRYLIYDLIGKKVRVVVPIRLRSPENEEIIEGWVNDVYRDVTDNHLKITIGETIYVFREPSTVCEPIDGEVAFVYGESNPDDSDEAFFEELENVSQRGGDVSTVLDSMETSEVTILRFEVLENADSKKRVRRRKKRKG